MSTVQMPICLYKCLQLVFLLLQLALQIIQNSNEIVRGHQTHFGCKNMELIEHFH